MKSQDRLALLGGPRAVREPHPELFAWPIITAEDETAVLEVLRRGAMSDLDVTLEFEKEFARWHGMQYAVGMNTGTAAVETAMFACGVGRGDEVIGPSLTYWASLLPAFGLGATVVFAEVDPDTLTLDPKDIEHRITNRTKAIVPVHYCGYPCDMDPIMAIARRHGIKVIEDCSHAQGGVYKGKKVGTFGEVAPMSLMSGKAFATGECGILVTNDREIYERSIAWGHYLQFTADAIQSPELRPYAGLPMGGRKYRVHQLSSAVGRVQIKYYDQRSEEIRRAMNHFWDLLEGVPGVRPHRPARDSGSTMGGWYNPLGLYVASELGGLSVTRYLEAVRAEGASMCYPGCNKPLHLHPLFDTCDIYHDGKPTRIAHSDRDLRQPRGSLPVTEAVGSRVYGIPWFKKYQPELIEQYANAFRKASQRAEELLRDDPGNPAELGDWHLSRLKT